MASYKYEGASLDGGKISGTVEAGSQTEAVAKIRQNCDMVLSLREVRRPSSRDALRFRKIKPKSLSLACRQFAIILKGGLPLVQAVDLVAEQCTDRELARLLRLASGDVSNGWSLSYSFQQRGAEALPVTFRETVRAGEESGDLLSAFSRMAGYFERISKTRSSLASALTSPAFVVLVAIAVIAVIMGFAVPTFTSAFAGLGTELPWVTRALIAVSGFFQKYILLLAAVLGCVVIGLRFYGRSPGGALRMARLQLRLPIAGGIVRMTNASQFAHTMNALLSSGMPILQALDAAGRTMENRAMSQEVLEAVSGVAAGRSLGECLSFTRDLPVMLKKMTAVGEDVGAMEAMLNVLADYYDNESSVRLKRFTDLLEPVIITVLAVIVAFILLAVYVPMFSMYNNIN